MITYSLNSSIGQKRLTSNSITHLRGQQEQATHELKKIHALGCILQCSCNQLKPKMHLRKIDKTYVLVNDSETGIHALSCEWFTRVKGVGRWQEEIIKEPTKLIETVLSSALFRRMSYGGRQQVQPLYQRWSSAIVQLEEELPSLTGLLKQSNKTEPGLLSIDITNSLDFLPKSCLILSNNKTCVSGPWLIFRHQNLAHPAVVPVLSLSYPLPLAHENDRGGILNVLKERRGKQVTITSGLYPVRIQDREVHASFFINGPKLEAVILISEKNEHTANRIKESMQRWGIETLLVSLHREVE